MRPRYLEIEGLHSFSENQEIDFDVLGEMGIFGIFGPTGSGKSTILDAITLALYGSVIRAKNGTQGIIASSSNTAKVSFTFDLQKNNARNTYRVERIYKRKKDSENSAEAKVVRLFEKVGEDWAIIADRLTDVNSKIEELIGLQEDDFTRSVVLPQNKFQEFLIMDKAKKRQMLERIFYLEEYGTKLSEKVSKNLAEVRLRLATVNGALGNLGEMSEKLFIEAEHRLVKARHLKDSSDKQLDKITVSYSLANELWALQQEIESVHQKIMELKVQGTEIENSRRSYELAFRAEGIVYFISNYKKRKESLDSCILQLNEINNKIQLSIKELDKGQLSYKSASEELASLKPGLVENRIRLLDALKMNDEIKTISLKLEELRTEYTGLKNKTTEKQNILTSIKISSEKAEKGLTDLSSQIDTLKTSQEYKEQIQKGVKIEEELTKSKLELDKLLNQINETSRKYNEIVSTISKLNELQVTYSNNKTLLGQKLEQHLKQKPGETFDVKNSSEDQFLEHAARILASSIKEGSPCPVCGSVEHPNPIIDGVNHHSEGDFKQQLELLKQSIEQWELTRDLLNSDIAEINEKITQNMIDLSTANTHKKVFEDEIARNQKSLEELAIVKEQKLEYCIQQYTNLNISNFIEELKRINSSERKIETLVKEKEKQEALLKADSIKNQQITQELVELGIKLEAVRVDGDGYNRQKKEKDEKVLQLTGNSDINKLLSETEASLLKLEQAESAALKSLKQSEEQHNHLSSNQNALKKQFDTLNEALTQDTLALNNELSKKGFASIDEAEACSMPTEAINTLKMNIDKYDKEVENLKTETIIVEKKLNGRSIPETEWNETNQQYDLACKAKEQATIDLENARNMYERVKTDFTKWLELEAERKTYSKKASLLEQIQKLLKGNTFVEFIAEERLRYVAREASETLGTLTRHRLGLELDTEFGFIIRDNANGGVLRLTSSLSGGETFLTSLSLAMALSRQIQLKGQSPLEFFFLDEGFGTLDSELLDTVMDSLEKLGSKERVIGLISHVPALRERMPRRLVVDAPKPEKSIGSRVRVDKA